MFEGEAVVTILKQTGLYMDGDVRASFGPWGQGLS